MTITDLRPLMAAAAAEYGLTPQLVEALVLQESGGNPWALNPEPRYRYFWDIRKKAPFRALTAAEIAAKIPPADFHSLAGDPDQEWWAQQASFGVCQVMGAVARELGCTEPYLTALCDPVIGLRFGCKKLAVEVKWADGDLSSALAAYNGGRGGNAPGTKPLRNAAYADTVLGRLAKITIASRVIN